MAFQRVEVPGVTEFNLWICLITNVLEGLVELSWSCATEEEEKEWNTG